MPVDPLYAERVASKFIPHLDKIAADARDGAKDLALTHYTETDPSKKSEIGNRIDAFLGRARTYGAIRSNLLADPLLDRDALAKMSSGAPQTATNSISAAPPAAAPSTPFASVPSPGDSIAGEKAA